MPHLLLLRLHFFLQHLRHVAHGQDHVIHPCLLDRIKRADRRAQPVGTDTPDFQSLDVPRPPRTDPGPYRGKGFHLVQQDGLIAEVYQRLRSTQR